MRPQALLGRGLGQEGAAGGGGLGRAALDAEADLGEVPERRAVERHLALGRAQRGVGGPVGADGEEGHGPDDQQADDGPAQHADVHPVRREDRDRSTPRAAATSSDRW